MIPHRLTMRNFLPYKNASLDMTGIHLACLSGDNGAGKSSILDAITFALWGKARADAGELVSQGEIEMSVDLEFEVGGQFYRVIRSHTRKSGGSNNLEVQARAGEVWKNIGESGLHAKQRQVIGLVQMEYETFINSAFLLQGRADEFTVKTPGDRKKILGEILGLSYYDELAIKAKTELDEANSENSRLRTEIARLDAIIIEKPRYEREKTDAEILLENIRLPLASNEDKVNRLRSRQKDLEAEDKRRLEAEQRLQVIGQRLKRLADEKTASEQNIAQAQIIIKRRDEIEQGYADLLAARAVEEGFSEKSIKSGELEKKRGNWEGYVERARNKVELERRLKAKGLDDKRTQVAQLPGLEQQLAELQNRLDAAITAGEQLQQAKADIATLNGDIKNAEGEVKRLKAELDKIKEKAERVPQPGDRCDHCGTVLTEDAREHTLNEYRGEYSAKASVIKEQQTRIEQLKTDGAKLRELVGTLEGPAASRSGLEAEKGGLTQQLTAIRTAQSELAADEARLAQIEQQLERGDYAQDEQAQLAVIIRDIELLGYDAKAHEAAIYERNQLKRFDTEKQRLDSAVATQERENANLARNAEQQTELQHDQQEQQRIARELVGIAQELAKLNQSIADLQAEINYSKREEEKLVGLIGGLKAQIENCNNQNLRKEQLDTELATVGERVSVYKELFDAFGKKGLQALVIDTVLPEIEDEANRLLHQMTDGRMSVTFDTQRQGKKGQAIETLDLRISDEGGSRPYELFSGGEAFRVNFAVRVALSKLLAHRSGAQLKTLVIDEGFGSQDGQGRERLVEAIRSIEEEFERILVVTHIPELKDMFPVRIDVVKTSSGSQISVN